MNVSDKIYYFKFVKKGDDKHGRTTGTFKGKKGWR